MPGALSGLKAAVLASERIATAGNDRAEVDFAKRVRVQQFLNQVGPIFRIHAGGKLPVSVLVEGTMLRDYAESVRRLAIAVSCGIEDKTPEHVDPVLVRIVTPAMAEFVAARIEADIPIDLVKDSDAIVSAIGVSNSKFDIDPFETARPSRECTVVMTAAGAVAGILAQLAWYDFRAEDISRTAARLMDALIARVSAIVSEIGNEMDGRSRAALMQSFIKHYAPILERAVARCGAQTLDALRPLSLPQRRDWYANNDPVGNAIKRFEEVSSAFGAAALVKELFEAAGPAKPNAQGGP